jgi:hypothetical protein
MRNDSINFRNSAVRFLFGCIAALANPASACLQAAMRRRLPAGGRSELMRDDLRPARECRAEYRCRPEVRGVAIKLGGGQRFHCLNWDEQGE